MKEPPEIEGNRFIVISLEAALLAFAKGENYPESVIPAVNPGEDADATGAICGQIAGA